MEPRNVGNLFREMFRGWDEVSQGRDARTGDFLVTLRVRETSLHRFYDPAELANNLWPRKPGKRLSGVRFHGRMVGRRK